MIPTSERGSIRIIHLQPKKEPLNPTLVFVGGMGSSVEDWRWLLHGVCETRELYYIESREKHTSTYSSRNDFSAPTLANDLEAVIKHLGLENGSFTLAGSSLGATTCILYATKAEILPSGIVVVGPVTRVPAKFWHKRVTYVPHLILTAAKPFWKWYVRNFVVDPKKDPEQAAKGLRNIDNAHMGKLMKGARHLIGLDINDELCKVSVPTLVLGASWDKAHSADTSKAIADGLQKGFYVDILTNARAHEYVALEVMDMFYRGEPIEGIREIAETPYDWQKEAFEASAAHDERAQPAHE